MSRTYKRSHYCCGVKGASPNQLLITAAVIVIVPLLGHFALHWF